MNFLAKTAVLAGGLVLLAGCSEGSLDDNKPSLNEIEDEMELRSVRLPDGRVIECIYFAENGSHKSWLAFDCNWSVPPLNG